MSGWEIHKKPSVQYSLHILVDSYFRLNASCMPDLNELNLIQQAIKLEISIAEM